MRKMFNIKYIIIVCLTFAAFLPVELNAQQKIDPTLEVMRDFDAYLLEVQKSKIKPIFPDSISKFNLNFDYSIFDKPLDNLYEFSPLPSAKIDYERVTNYPLLWTNLGVNFPFNPHIDLVLQPKLPSNFLFALYGGYNSFLGKVDRIGVENGKAVRTDNKIYSPEYNGNLGLKFNYSYKKGEIGLKLQFDKAMYSFYGGCDSSSQDFTSYKKTFLKDTLSHSFNRFGTHIYLKSTNERPNYFYYELNLKYSYIDDKVKYLEILHQSDNNNTKYSFNENYMNVNATLGPVFAEFHRFLVGIDYKASNSVTSSTLDRYYVEAFPRYVFNQNRWIFEVGLKLGKYVDDFGDDFDFFPKGSLSYELARKRVWLYASLDGHSDFYSYSRLMDINPWITPSIDIQKSSTPWIVQGGIRGKIIDRISFNLWMGFTDYNKYLSLFHYTDSTTGVINTFQAKYYDMQKISAGGELLWKSDAVTAGINIKYNDYENDDKTPVYNLPSFDALIFGRYSWRERIIASLSINHRSKFETTEFNKLQETTSPDTIITIPSTTFVNLDATYVFNKNLSFYLKLNNLLNANDFSYIYYGNTGFGVGFGIALKI